MTDVPGGETTADWTTPIRHGVTVQHVRELATHIERLTARTDDPDFGARRVQITDTQVARWIELVADSVDARMVALSQYTTNTGLWAGILGSARTAITNGAAAYLVSAAFPARAGTNDQANYSAELTARYEREIAFLTQLPEQLADEDSGIVVPVDPGADTGIRLAGTRRPPAVPDDSELFFRTRGLPGRPDPYVYRRSPAPGAEDPYTYRLDPGTS